MTVSRVFSRGPGLVVLITLTAAVTGLPALAQDNHIQRYDEKDKEETTSEKAAKKEAERAYQRSLGNIPAQKSTDPWGIVRSDDTASKDTPKAANKTASPKPKAKNESKNEAKNEAKNQAKNQAKTDSAAKQ
jgi:hypothetical protein